MATLIVGLPNRGVNILPSPPSDVRKKSYLKERPLCRKILQPMGIIINKVFKLSRQKMRKIFDLKINSLSTALIGYAANTCSPEFFILPLFFRWFSSRNLLFPSGHKR
jgi:ribosomal protein S14